MRPRILVSIGVTNKKLIEKEAEKKGISQSKAVKDIVDKYFKDKK